MPALSLILSTLTAALIDTRSRENMKTEGRIRTKGKDNDSAVPCNKSSRMNRPETNVDKRIAVMWERLGVWWSARNCLFNLFQNTYECICTVECVCVYVRACMHACVGKSYPQHLLGMHCESVFVCVFEIYQHYRNMVNTLSFVQWKWAVFVLSVFMLQKQFSVYFLLTTRRASMSTAVYTFVCVCVCVCVPLSFIICPRTCFNLYDLRALRSFP